MMGWEVTETINDVDHFQMALLLAQGRVALPSTKRSYDLVAPRQEDYAILQ